MSGSEPIVLASGSPRRTQLLGMLGIEHIVDPAHVPEERGPEEPAAEYATRLAREKAQSVSARHPGRWVLGGDTVVVLDGDVLEKPSSPDHAVVMLKRLIGRGHEVISALALVRDDWLQAGYDVTSVWFREVDEELLRGYVATGEPLDKAGSYGAQGVGSILIDRIDGDFYGVMGMPVRLLVDLLDRAGRPFSF